MPLTATPFQRFIWFFSRPKTFGISCIVMCRDEVLLVDYRYGHGWNFPTGLIRDDESPQDAARRELSQEFVLKIQHPRYLGYVFCRFQHRRDKVYCFTAEVNEKTLLIRNKDVRNAQWYPIYALPVISPFSSEIVERWFKKTRRTAQTHPHTY
jgi:ADP-ribose pyrophosphatase YjhB (NUDIX family)